jgi:hypothetical protein
MTKQVTLLSIPLIFTLITGCATTPKDSGPSNIRGVKEFTLEPVKLESITVDDLKEEDYKAKKEPNQLRQWEDDKDAMKSRFATSLKETVANAGLTISDSAAGQHYTIRPVITKIDTGYYRIPAWNAVSRVYVHITVVDPAGKAVDETDAQGSKTFDAIAAPDSGGRLRSSASEAGERYGRYLEKRTRS